MAFRRIAALVIVMTASMCSAQVQCPGGWTIAAHSGPPITFYTAVAFDSDRSRIVLFGGFSDNVYSGETWEWDGSTWMRVATTGPSPRASARMAYDSVRHQTVLFGGGSGSGPFGDTWVWDGATWTMASSSGPSARAGQGMAFDGDRAKVVLFGGGLCPFACTNDTWEWDGANWTLISNIGPPAQELPAMVYDSARHKSVLFGQGQTWEFDGPSHTWTQVVTTPSPALRHRHAMAFDSVRSKTVLYGGDPNEKQFFTDTWEYDGTGWNLTVPEVGPPGQRSFHSMAYDSARGQVVLYGGRHMFGPEQQDTWTYAPDCCTADWNGSGVVDSQDYFDFVSAFFAGMPRADFNHSGQVDSQDYFDFLNAFFAGCPR
jgi:hypothetical protein